MSEIVDTLDEDIQNTNTELDEINDNDSNISDIDIDNGNNSDEGYNESIDEDDVDSVSKEQLDALNDDEFTEYLNTGKLPNHIKTNSNKNIKEDIKDTTVNTEPTTNSVKQEQVEEQKQEDTKEETATDTIDYKAVYDSIFKPFKANGKTIAPRNAEDVISLMQMGANYTKKMQLMAPMKRAVESLNKAGINEEELNFLIDIHNGDKEAIKNLLKKNEIDPIDLDMEDTKYIPKNNIASDADVEFSETLMDIESSLPKIQEILNKTWDSKSKQLVLKDPQLMRALHQEIEMGRFDEVQQRLEIEKTFGRYKGVSDIEAYIDLVTKMVNEKARTPVTETKHVERQPETTTKSIPDKTKAAPVRSKPKNQGSTLTAKDLFSMSEEEFNKLSINDLI